MFVYNVLQSMVCQEGYEVIVSAQYLSNKGSGDSYILYENISRKGTVVLPVCNVLLVSPSK